jgi:tetratricopeptide (TPR) repeat protein
MFLFFVLLPGCLLAQYDHQRAVDSLLTLLPRAAEDTAKVSLMNHLSHNLFTIKPDEGLRFGNRAWVLAQKLGWQRGVADADMNLAANEWASHDYQKALEYGLSALTLYERLGDKKFTARALSTIGVVNQAMFNYPKSLEYLWKAVIIEHELGDKAEEEGNRGNLGMVYEDQHDQPNAMAQYQKALALDQEMGDNRRIANVCIYLSTGCSSMGQYQQALDYGQRALNAFTLLGDEPGVGRALANLGIAYRNQHAFRQALVYEHKALATLQSFNDVATRGIYGDCLDETGDIYLDMGQLSNAVAYLKKAVVVLEAADDDNALERAFKDLSTAQARQGHYAEALESYRQYDFYKEKVSNIDRNNDISRLELRYEYDREKDSLNDHHQLQTAQLNTLVKDQEVSRLRLKQQLLVALIGIVILTMGGLYLSFRSRIQRLRLKNELANITLSSLRARMNPHFIFNCLNSIKLYTEENNMEAASEYLSKFSKLIRNLLDSAHSDKVDLSSEIASLRLYLEMEAMRFKEKLQYSIEVDKGVDADFIEIPPMLIQPYVENAIWHGLMQKEGGGSIHVRVTQQFEDSMLVITVRDNGIGRAKSAELKSKTAVQQKSYGTRITSERIALINETYNAGADIVITDMETEDHQPLGTLVTIEIPIK